MLCVITGLFNDLLEYVLGLAEVTSNVLIMATHKPPTKRFG